MLEGYIEAYMNLRSISSLDVTLWGVRRVLCLQIIAVFWIGVAINYLSRIECRNIIILGGMKYAQLSHKYLSLAALSLRLLLKV